MVLGAVLLAGEVPTLQLRLGEGVTVGGAGGWGGHWTGAGSAWPSRADWWGLWEREAGEPVTAVGQPLRWGVRPHH
ncbi:hypothetical protein SAMN05444921_13435 [Streptomyces wuyuanensis]|uniref:Uncharacterized protein n=1 Tax=Streptomyces wuyuanensis TaxID=1196353 RepID=A0A1H0DJG3_9ACTN|nr:hypothetical protein SAMN05444921_13435 [Streptomyces wuyuanensis]